MMFFVDSWGWITLASQKDSAFEKTSFFYKEQGLKGSKPLTTDYVLAEAITFIFARLGSHIAIPYFENIFKSMREGHLRLVEINRGRFEKAWQLRKRYKDKPRISFTDLTTFVVMKEVGMTSVLTDDHHFEEVNLGFRLFP